MLKFLKFCYKFQQNVIKRRKEKRSRYFLSWFFDGWCFSCCLQDFRFTYL